MEKDGFEQKLIDLRRVTRVSAGGKRFNFRATMIIGNRGGKVGVGIGKGADTTLAINKAVHQAKKNIINVRPGKNESLDFQIESKYKSALILIKPRPAGHGLIAGGVIRLILDYAGIKNAASKIISSSKNKINIAMATINALKKLEKYYDSNSSNSAKI